MTTYPNPLTEIIKKEIHEHGGHLSFARFMELALYHESYGYYNAHRFTIGKDGDFTTAPQISPLFAQCIARQCQQILATLSAKNILELGAGTGQLAVDLLLALEQLKQAPTHYYIYEISSALRARQKKLLQERCPQLADRVIWLDKIPAGFEGIMIGNEVLDALPVHCFEVTTDGIQERCVSLDGDALSWTLAKPTTPELAAASQISELYQLPPGYRSEINLNMNKLVHSLAQHLAEGVILLFDYGYGQAEYYHPERNQGTLTCFYQHRHHNNPLIHIGQQDITAHVDFTRVIEEAHEYGCILAGYTTQAAFLLSCGLIDLASQLEPTLSAIDAFQMHHAIKLLTLPTEMGERIKVMGLAKHMTLPLIGFAQHDRRRDL